MFYKWRDQNRDQWSKTNMGWKLVRRLEVRAFEPFNKIVKLAIENELCLNKPKIWLASILLPTTSLTNYGLEGIWLGMGQTKRRTIFKDHGTEAIQEYKTSINRGLALERYAILPTKYSIVCSWYTIIRLKHQKITRRFDSIHKRLW